MNQNEVGGALPPPPRPPYSRPRAGWEWWRVVLTVLIVAVGGVAWFVAMAGALGDPGSGGDTAQFEHTKTLAALMFFAVPLLAAVLLTLVHLPAMRARSRRR